MKYTVVVNGEKRTVDVPERMPLLWVLRDVMDLKGTKFGCGVAQCGACTVLLDGQPIRSCITPISSVGTAAVTTIESLPRDGSHPLQRAWMELDVPQCGYCQAGQLMAASALLKSTPNPTDQQIDALLKAGADPNGRTPEGETPLMAVARAGKVDAAKRLLEAGADINAKEDFGGQTALMWAAAQSQVEMVKLLASKGADLNARGIIRQWERKIITEPRPKDMNKGGFTPLIYAAREGCVECARYLVEAGADFLAVSGAVWNGDEAAAVREFARAIAEAKSGQ